MISASDLVHLQYSPDLTEAGISLCRRSLPWLRDRRGRDFVGRLRRRVAGVAVELAFRRYLGQLEIPLRAARGPTFTNIERYDLTLGGHRCNIVSYLISDPQDVARLSADSASALSASALIPADRYWADGRLGDDIHIFAFVAGLTNDPIEGAHSPPAAGKQAFLLHVMPVSWASPRRWLLMSPLVLKSGSDQSLLLELGGQDAAGQFCSRAVELRPRTRIEIDQAYYSLSHLHTKLRPDGAIGVGCPAKRDPHFAGPEDWADIWVHGTSILLLGWMRHDEFRRRAQVIPAGSRVFQFGRTRTANLAVPVADLKPLDQLLAGMLKNPATG